MQTVSPTIFLDKGYPKIHTAHEGALEIHPENLNFKPQLNKRGHLPESS